MSTFRLLRKPLAIPLYSSYARYASTNATKSTTVQRTEEAGQAVSTSSSSELAPIPQEKDVLVTADVLSGAPLELRHRLVRIYQPTRNTMQSGGTKGDKWRIDWDVLPGAGRWQNPLMGWASSADYMQGTKMLFNTKEDAIRFAEKQGWDHYVQPSTIKRVPPKNYSENFLYRSSKLRIARTK